MQASGADVIEVGMPFSDPMAEGTTIQLATTMSLSHGTTYDDCLEFVREARSQGLTVPVLFMGYLNPLIAYGEHRAVTAAKKVGANGFIVVDLPLEEQPDFFKAVREEEMSFIPLVAPTSLDKRIKMLADAADSFIYCVSVTGVTGARTDVSDELPSFLERIRRITDLPLAVGFGISTREHFVKVGKIAEGVVIGSQIIKTILNADGEYTYIYIYLVLFVCSF